MHMAVDEPRRDDAACERVNVARMREAPTRMHARDHRADDADIRLAQFERRDVDDPAAGQQQVERLLALRRGDGAQPRRKLDRLVHYSALMFAALTMTENFSISWARKAVNSAGLLPTMRRPVSASFARTSASCSVAVTA